MLTKPSKDVEEEDLKILRLGVPVTVTSATCVYTVHDAASNSLIDITQPAGAAGESNHSSSSQEQHQQQEQRRIVRAHGYVQSAAMAGCQVFVKVAACRINAVSWPTGE